MLRKKQYPALAAMVDVQIAEIAVDTKKKPNTVFTRMCCGAKTKEEAKARAKRELWPQLCELARLLYRPVWEINVQAGEVTMEQFVDYMADSLMRMGSADAQLHTISCLRRYILPVIGNIRLCDLTAEAQDNASKKSIGSCLKQRCLQRRKDMSDRRTVILSSSLPDVATSL